MKKNKYTAPAVKVVVFSIEHGYAGSFTGTSTESVTDIETIEETTTTEEVTNSGNVFGGSDFSLF